MERFYEEYKLLVNTETSYKDGAPHALLTGTDNCTQYNAGQVIFDYQKVYDREDTYHDVVGFYHTHPSGMSDMSGIDIETMRQWVLCLGKNLICIIETDDTLKGWMCIKSEDGQVAMREINVSTRNDVNYDVWFDSGASFWHPTDFLLHGERFEDDGTADGETDGEVLEAVLELQENQENLIVGFNTLVDAVQSLIQVLTKEEDDEQDT